jgi:hypothetical protein
MASTGGTIPLRASDRGVMMVVIGFVLNLSSKAHAHEEKLASSSMTWAMENLYLEERVLILLPRDNARKELSVATSIRLKTMGLETRPCLQGLALTSSGRESVEGELNAGNRIGFHCGEE